ncbi:MAG: GDSL-type esterase/lipase family protein [Natronospirillum sp.]
MPTILCYGDSNTWGAPPCLPGQQASRYPSHVRWPGVLATQLGEDYTVVESGLCGRTSCFSDPVQGEYLNGLAHLPVALHTHSPLDMVIIMLGTNDLKTRFNATAQQVANNVGTLVEQVWAHLGEDMPVLIICPPQAKDVDIPKSPFAGADSVSEGMHLHFGRMAVDKDVPWLDAGDFIVSSNIVGIHLYENAHRLLGEVVADKVLSLL